jgi:methionyl-tRNA synthetase
MSSINPQAIVTCALPYANGDLHLGHLVEYLQADIWVRFHKMQKRQYIFICGDDAHGTPIMLSAKQRNITPEQLLADMRASRLQDFADFYVEFDNYYTTHSAENRVLAEMVYERLLQRGDISKRTIRQAYDPKENMFLPDRYVKGECPHCAAKDQYGDNCENCGATYSPLDLKNPISVVSGVAPIEKSSEHYFFQLANYTNFLKNWLSEKDRLQEEVHNKLMEWFKTGLQDWDISRDAPYFGFPIPNSDNKYFYVWLDAPIGYIASFKKLCEQRPELNFESFWQPESRAALYHFIGKDIVNFHALFWPAMLQGAQLRTPTAIFTHGYLTVDGQKMSKSRGTFIKARTYLNYLNPEYLRYYYAAKLNATVEDIDLNLADFVQRVNADLVGKVVNIASRCASFIHKYFNGELASTNPQTALFNEFVQTGVQIAKLYQKREFNRAVRLIMELADKANQYIDAEKPWSLIKQAGQEQQVQLVCSLGLNLFKTLIIYLKPILPHTAQRAEEFLNIPALTWADNTHYLINHKINPFIPLLQRIEEAQINAMKEAAKEELKPMTNKASNNENEKNQSGKGEEKHSHSRVSGNDEMNSALAADPLRPEIAIEDFAKIDLRIARIVNAEAVPEAEKLLKLTLDLGGQTRQVFAGIKSAYQPDEIIGKLTVMVANLAPRKMRFGVSEGMVLAAGPGGEDLWILHPDEGAQPGMRVK